MSAKWWPDPMSSDMQPRHACIIPNHNPVSGGSFLRRTKHVGRKLTQRHQIPASPHLTPFNTMELLLPPVELLTLAAGARQLLGENTFWPLGNLNCVTHGEPFGRNCGLTEDFTFNSSSLLITKAARLLRMLRQSACPPPFCPYLSTKPWHT